MFGDDNTTLHGLSHGGNDALTVHSNYGWNTALVVGDAQAMIDNAKGGNDTINVEADSMYTNVHAFGDVAGDMSGNSHGGSDTIVGAVGWRDYDNVYAGDAGGSMSGTAHGGNDTLDID